MVIKKKIKKSSKKTSSSNKKKMKVVSGELCFWINNGPILSSLGDLHKALLNMNEEQFRHHVGKQKNDFALWVRTVLSDYDCAKSLMVAKTKSDSIKVVKSAITKYQ